MKISDFLLRVKIVFDRGKLWISYVNFMFLAFVTVSSMKQYEAFAFLSSSVWMFLLLGGTTFFVCLIGFFEICVLKTYQKEAEIYIRIHPFYRQALENQEKILEVLYDNYKGD